MSEVFTLAIDARLRFDPPMSDKEAGILLTTTVELPFVPTSDLMLTGRAFNDRPDPMGVCLKEVTWDIDRRVFLAYTEQSYAGFSILSIPQELRQWLDRGWRLGSYADAYESRRRRKSKPTPAIRDRPPKIDDEVAERLPTLPPRKRPPYFNKLMQALVREMALLDNNWPVAYAMHKTKMFFEKSESDSAPQTAQMKKFFAAIQEFRKLPFERQCRWRDQVVRRNPHLEQFLRYRLRRSSISSTELRDEVL